MIGKDRLVISAVLLWAGAPCMAPAYADQHPAPVDVVKVARAPFHEEIPLTGSVESKRVSRISPKINGFVADVLVDEGDQVKTGQPLLHLREHSHLSSNDTICICLFTSQSPHHTTFVVGSSIN